MRVASIKHAVEMKVVADTVAVLQMKAPPQRKARPDYKALWGLAAAQARQPQLAKLTRAVNATAATQWSLISRSDRRSDAVDSGDAASADGAASASLLLLDQISQLCEGRKSDAAARAAAAAAAAAAEAAEEERWRRLERWAELDGKVRFAPGAEGIVQRKLAKLRSSEELRVELQRRVAVIEAERAANAKASFAKVAANRRDCTVDGLRRAADERASRRGVEEARRAAAAEHARARAEAEGALLLGAALQRLQDERDAAAMLTPRPPPQSARGARPTSSVRHRRVMSARVARECA